MLAEIRCQFKALAFGFKLRLKSAKQAGVRVCPGLWLQQKKNGRTRTGHKNKTTAPATPGRCNGFSVEQCVLSAR